MYVVQIVRYSIYVYYIVYYTKYSCVMYIELCFFRGVIKITFTNEKQKKKNDYSALPMESAITYTKLLKYDYYIILTL